MSYVPSGQSDFKKPVRAATTANINLASPGSTVDGVTLSAGDRVLVKNQTTASENGIYVFATSSTAMVRSTDANGAGELDSGTLVVVEEGSANADTVWVVSTNGVITIGTTGIAFAQASGGGSSSASGVSYGGSTNLSATDVEAALDELDAEKAAASHSHDGITPIGGVIDYFGGVELSGWLFPNGQAISRSTYADLFALLGTTFGAGDGSTTFNLPDMRGRVGVMRDASAGVLTGTDALGTVEGAQTVTLTGANLPSHDHGGSITSGGAKADFNAAVTSEGGKADFNAAVTSSQNTHSHNLTYNTVSNTTTTGTAQRTTNITTSSGANSVTSQSDSHSHTIAAADLDAAQADHTHQITAASLDAAQADHTHSISVSSAYGNNSGGVDSHQNMQPSMRVNKLIRVL